MRNEKISNEDILNMIGEMAAKQDDECFAKLEEAADALDIAPDEKILAMARQYDQKKNRKPIKRWISVISKLAAVFVIGVILSLGTVDSSHHITRHGGFIMEEHPENGSVSFRSEKQLLLSEHENVDMWYPSYLPWDVELIYEEIDREIFMLFQSKDNKYQMRIEVEHYSDVSFSYDTDFTTIKEFDIDKCSGYIANDNEGYCTYAFWIIEDEFIGINVMPSISEEEMLKIVQGMELKNN